jgi:hypothetical protein
MPVFAVIGHPSASEGGIQPCAMSRVRKVPALLLQGPLNSDFQILLGSLNLGSCCR